ncbi:nucleotide disphospho-sugar-binding domain-containing protein [Streptomyces sp. MS1.HAVA.3]|uniref:Nucleotide disphospho-sugar-binding domain-containing protein n=1 Tax=Streptomyces caledonius TaxID=3134107 RepID=A0ABU8U284_9ACTN
MRVLIATPSLTERLHNLVPLAWALRAAGHDVQVAARPAFTVEVNRTGLVAAAWGGEGARDGEGAADVLARHTAAFRADLLLWDELAPAAGDVAAAAGIPSVRVLAPGSAPDPEGARDDVPLTVDPTSPALRAPLDPGHRRVRHVPYAGPAEIPAWLRKLPKRPRIAVTLTGEKAPVAEVFEALADVDAEVIATLPAERIPEGTTVPDNIRFFDTAPWIALAQSSAAVVHDAGILRMADVLAYGLPQCVLLGQDAQERTVRAAHRLAEHGAGFAVEQDLLDGSGLRAAVEALARDAGPAERAAGLRAREVAQTPSPRELVAVLEGLIQGPGRPVRGWGRISPLGSVAAVAPPFPG